MHLIMNDERLQIIEQVKKFLVGNETVDFGGISVGERYRWIDDVPPENDTRYNLTESGA